MRRRVRDVFALLLLLVVVVLINVVLNLSSLPAAVVLRLHPPSADREPTPLTPLPDQLRHRLYKNLSRYRAPLDLVPRALRPLTSGLPVTLTAEEFRADPGLKTGNPLIDCYGINEASLAGEGGGGLVFAGKEKKEAEALEKEFNVNVMASDFIPLNRRVPDARFEGCANLTYQGTLPTTTIIIPFYNEWPSVLLRTVYSVINRTPRPLLQEVLLVDDSSTMEELKEPLNQYINDHFPRDLVRVVRMPSREGLIHARNRGFEESRGQVLVFFDSHMEVNIDWLPPLLAEIRSDRRTVAMANLDYVDRHTLQYQYYEGRIMRYGFDWRLSFFEFYFRRDQIDPSRLLPRPGVVMVGPAFAIDRLYFKEMGGYDFAMQVWGGENLEMAWRVWMCGGRLLHIPCSHVGHIARGQPYSFPKGRRHTELHNYKRAVMVWMGEYKEFVFDNYPEMKDLDVGDLSERLALKERLKCHNFSWFMDHVWPELTVYSRQVTGWGSLVNRQSKNCVDSHNAPWEAELLYVHSCHFQLHTQGVCLTQSGLLRTTLQCVVLRERTEGARPKQEDCITGARDRWKHTAEGQMIHVDSQLCLDEDPSGPVMMTCASGKLSQLWSFTRP